MVMIKNEVRNRGMDGNNRHSPPTYLKQKYVEICAKLDTLFIIMQ